MNKKLILCILPIFFAHLKPTDTPSLPSSFKEGSTSFLNAPLFNVAIGVLGITFGYCIGFYRGEKQGYECGEKCEQKRVSQFFQSYVKSITFTRLLSLNENKLLTNSVRELNAAEIFKKRYLADESFSSHPANFKESINKVSEKEWYVLIERENK